MGAKGGCDLGGGGLHVCGLQDEADVLATHSISSGEAESAAKMSSGKIHYGPSGGYCCKKKRAGGVKITCGGEKKNTTCI